MTDRTETIYTIGHSNHSIDRFLELLAAHQITAVADVRSQPYSRFTPHFNRERLQSELKAKGIAYVFLGHELGARSDDPDCYIDGKVQYDRLAQSDSFKDGLTRVLQGAKKHHIALMCAEKDPLTCHRGILICRQLANARVAIRHILEDGELETHDAALCRLLSELDLAENDLFRSRDEVIQDAYDLRGKEIAYTQQDPTEE